MPWTEDSKPHIEHLSDLMRMLTSSAKREYGIGNEPEGFIEKWTPFFNELYVAACLMYLEKVFATDRHWQSSTNIAQYPNLHKKLECLRCMRNCIVHNGATMAGWGSTGQIQTIRDFDRDVRAGVILEEFGNQAGQPTKPFFAIGPSNEITEINAAAVRYIIVQYLMVEGKAATI